MPPAPPVHGFTTSNAFPGLTFGSVVGMATPPGETNRLFVLDEAGRILVITNLANPTLTTFMDLSGQVYFNGESGLLGLAFHPGYASNRYFFVFYSLMSSTTQHTNYLHQRLSRFQTSPNDPNQAPTNSEVVLISQADDAPNHNGGDLHFGPDGYLYVSLGDGGMQYDGSHNSQRIDKDFFSAIMRLDVDSPPRAGSLLPNPHPANTNFGINYRIPADNPYIGRTRFDNVAVNPTNVHTEFYAVGFRNPWRFSFDPVTGFLYCGDVGQDTYEEVDVVTKGGDYGWAYREGLHAGYKSGSPGEPLINPIQEYAHSANGTNQGNAVIGGVVYRGSRLSQLVGMYVFGDNGSGNIWALRYNVTNTVPFVQLTTLVGLSALGTDPSNGDVLLANVNNGVISRLIYNATTTGTPLPATLFQTGAFTNLTSLAAQTDPLTPNVGVMPYDINVPFWSDNARKTRWVFRSNTNLAFSFSPNGNWSFPTGTVWVKHFDLELTNGVASSAKRLETRLLVKNSGGIYGVTYRWGSSLTNATLVPEEGMDETFTIYDGGTSRAQNWHYPSRGECIICHTPAGGYALGFRTEQLNRDVDFGSGPTNQLAALSHGGYFSAPITNLKLLPMLVPATNSDWSREWRVRSYLAANCRQCHQPGGSALGYWDARSSNALSASGLINGALNNNFADTNNRVIVPGSPAHSMLLSRISTRGPTQMPPLDSSVLDTQAIALVTAWITNDLPNYKSFPDWQLAFFGATNTPDALASSDPDADGARNQLEWLTGTSPILTSDFWSGPGIGRFSNSVSITYPRIRNRGFEVQWTTNLFTPSSWQALDVPENRPFFAATNSTALVPDAIGGASKFYRMRVYEP